MKGQIFIPLLFVIIAFGILMTSGMLVNKSATNPNEQFDMNPGTPDPNQKNLQLQTLKPIPRPTATKNFECGDAISGSREPFILWAIAPDPGTPVQREGSIKAFYEDEHPLTLGVGNVSTSPTGKDHVANPSIGDESARDLNGFPYYPALFISDTTNDPNNRSGDAQNNGTPHKPDEVFGAWQSKGSPSFLPPNNLNMGTEADPFPATSNVTFTTGGTRPREESYGAEIVWHVENLGLTSGHTYRAQFILHDGDSEGDISEGCTTIDF